MLSAVIRLNVQCEQLMIRILKQCPRACCKILKSSAHTQNDICCFCQCVGAGSPSDSDRAEIELMILRQSRFARLSLSNRDLVFLHKRPECGACIRIMDTSSGDEQG